MRFGAFTYAYSTNIGDDIQTIAASRFLPRVDVLVERDRLHWYRGGPGTFVIFNGWFTHQPHWPPPASLRPLLVSFHTVMPELLLHPRHAGYFRAHEPIGCRSAALVEAFQSIGVEAYFSGCLTLTLQNLPCRRTDQIYAVDVEEDLYHDLVPRDVREQAVRWSHELPAPNASPAVKAKWRGLHYTLRALNKFDRDTPLIRSLRHRLYRVRHEAHRHVARATLERYAQARLVITSRLHCALPCLALGTPVVLLRRGVESDPRFAGLHELVRCASGNSTPPDINWQNPEPNPDDYLRYARALEKRCVEAVACAEGKATVAAGIE